jgi:hypothetical protein
VNLNLANFLAYDFGREFLAIGHTGNELDAVPLGILLIAHGDVLAFAGQFA